MRHLHRAFARARSTLASTPLDKVLEKPIFFDMCHSNNAARVRLWMALKRPGGMGHAIESRMLTYPDLKKADFAAVNPLKKVACPPGRTPSVSRTHTALRRTFRIGACAHPARRSARVRVQRHPLFSRGQVRRRRPETHAAHARGPGGDGAALPSARPVHREPKHDRARLLALAGRHVPLLRLARARAGHGPAHARRQDCRDLEAALPLERRSTGAVMRDGVGCEQAALLARGGARGERPAAGDGVAAAPRQVHAGPRRRRRASLAGPGAPRPLHPSVHTHAQRAVDLTLSLAALALSSLSPT